MIHCRSLPVASSERWIWGIATFNELTLTTTRTRDPHMIHSTAQRCRCPSAGSHAAPLLPDIMLIASLLTQLFILGYTMIRNPSRVAA